MARSKSSFVAKAFGSGGVFASAIPERTSSGEVSKAAVVSGAPTISATAPTSPSAGDLWYNSTAASLFVYVPNQWTAVSTDKSIAMAIALG